MGVAQPIPQHHERCEASVHVQESRRRFDRAEVCAASCVRYFLELRAKSFRVVGVLVLLVHFEQHLPVRLRRCGHHHVHSQGFSDVVRIGVVEARGDSLSRPLGFVRLELGPIALHNRGIGSIADGTLVASHGQHLRPGLDGLDRGSERAGRSVQVGSPRSRRADAQYVHLSETHQSRGAARLHLAPCSLRPSLAAQARWSRWREYPGSPES
eukprot:scaffold7595_cov267-Pinguiococcus_pyrenoidosus.AAC.18